MRPNRKGLVLGTALWGWGICKAEAFALLDEFVSCGGCVVDTAVNYPINKKPEDMGKAVEWLSEWVNANGKLEIYLKVGAKNNLGGPDIDLSSLSLQRVLNDNKSIFGPSLTALAIHWDSREWVDSLEIEDTLNFFNSISEKGFDIGFSGVSQPKLYLDLAPKLADSWCVQVKENFLTRSSRENYQAHFPKARYFAYGINMGGVKSEESSTFSSLSLRGVSEKESWNEYLNGLLEALRDTTPKPNSFSDLSLLRAFLTPDLSGVIIGPRTVDQLRRTLRFWAELEAGCELVELPSLPLT